MNSNSLKSTAISNQDNIPYNQDRHDLHQENKLLKNQLRDLIDSVGSYRGTQRRFEEFELKLLECQNFKTLIDCLIETVTIDFSLDKVSLTLFDPNNIAREMLGPVLPHQKHLSFVDVYQQLCLPFRELQASDAWPGGSPGAMRPQLSSSLAYIKRLSYPTYGRH